MLKEKALRSMHDRVHSMYNEMKCLIMHFMLPSSTQGQSLHSNGSDALELNGGLVVEKMPHGMGRDTGHKALCPVSTLQTTTLPSPVTSNHPVVVEDPQHHTATTHHQQGLTSDMSPFPSGHHTSPMLEHFSPAEPVHIVVIAPHYHGGSASDGGAHAPFKNHTQLSSLKWYSRVAFLASSVRLC